MPRPRKPVNILALNGAFEKNPSRAAGRAPGAPAAPLVAEPPSDLPEDIKAAWREIVSTAAPGVLTTVDTIAVRSCARLLARENAGTISAQERMQLHKLLGDFGMSPKGRNYVTVPVAKARNQFSDL